MTSGIIHYLKMKKKRKKRGNTRLLYLLKIDFRINGITALVFVFFSFALCVCLCWASVCSTERSSDSSMADSTRVADSRDNYPCPMNACLNL